MTKAQRIVILIGMFLILASGLYPPWRMVRAAYPTHSLVTIKYGWIVAPPHVWEKRQQSVFVSLTLVEVQEIRDSIGKPPKAPKSKLLGNKKPKMDIVPWSEVEPRLDVYRLGFEWILVGIVTSGLCLALKPSKCQRPPG